MNLFEENGSIYKLRETYGIYMTISSMTRCETYKIQMRFFTTELNKFKQLKHGHKKQPLHYGDYLQLLTIIVPSYTPSIFFFDFHVYNP
jgi:hypothetical protein